jgi:superfamily II helicase
MTDNEIIKFLESILDRMRAYESNQASIGKGLVKDIISMHDRQNAEIERLTVELVGMRGACESYKMHYDNAQAEIERLKKTIVDLNANLSESVNCFTRMETLYKIKCKELEVAKSEAIKEFAERLTNRICKNVNRSLDNPNGYNYYPIDVYEDIDNLVKEMTERKDEGK